MSDFKKSISGNICYTFQYQKLMELTGGKRTVLYRMGNEKVALVRSVASIYNLIH